MDFVTTISTGAESKYIVEEYAYAFLKAVTESPKFWRAKIAHQFVSQCFQAVGLNFDISVADFYKTQDYPYRNDNANYIFQPIASVLEGLDVFLEELPPLLALYDRELATSLGKAKSASAKRFDEMTRPFPCYLQVVAIWIQVVQSICGSAGMEEMSVDKYLYEPMARISFSILRGLVKELPRHGGDLPCLKEICLALNIYVRFGVYFDDTNRVILKPMLDIFRDYVTTFFGEDKSALNFIYYNFCVEMSNEEKYYVMFYEFLEDRIQEFARSKQRDPKGNLYLRIITNDLITDKYLIIQLETLQKQTSKPLLLATLRYLMTLQNHVASLELFPKRLLEEMLRLILRMPASSSAVRNLAAELYIKMAKRLFYEQDIALHILDTFGKFQSGRNKNQTYECFRSQFARYLKTLIEYFPALQRFDFYKNILRRPSQELILPLSILAAQAICILFELHKSRYAESEESLTQIDGFLAEWPQLLEGQAPQTRSVLYSVYKTISFSSVAVHNDELLCTLENFVLDKFLHDFSLTDTELYGLYESLSRSLQATGNLHIHKIAERELLVDCGMLQIHLEEERAIYCHAIARIHALLRNKKLSASSINNLYDTLAVELMDKPEQAQKLVYYGPETLAYMLLLVLKEPSEPETDENVLRLVIKLMDFCITHLSGTTNNPKKIRSLFCAFLLLHISLGNLGLTISVSAYDILLEQLSKTSMMEKARSDVLIYIYYREMHSYFRKWQGCREISLPKQRIWKVLMPFKMSSSSLDLVSPELEKLINTLISQRVDTYTHSLAVILLHISDDVPTRRHIPAAINGHLSHITSQASSFDAWLIRFITYQTFLALLYKKLTVQRPDTVNSREHNRLMSLQYIMELVKPLRLENFHFNKISRWVYSLKMHAVSPNEKERMNYFIEQLSIYKYTCEYENNEASITETFEGQLMPLPAGPLAEWQVQMLHGQSH